MNICLVRPKDISNDDIKVVNDILQEFNVFYIKWTENCDNGWGNNDNYDEFITSLYSYLKDIA